MGFPATRPRRWRASAAGRRLVREHALSRDDLIWPLFIREEQGTAAVAAMPGVERLGPDALLAAAEQALALGIPAIALFPVIDAADKSPQAEEALNPDGLVPRSLRALKQAHPELLLISDVALDPYTSHGQDGIVDESGYVLNDPTVDILARQALVHARAGADVMRLPRHGPDIGDVADLLLIDA